MRPLRWKRSRIDPANAVWPSTADSSVLLPAPLGPTTTWIEPAGIASETSRTTTRVSRLIVTRSSSTAAWVICYGPPIVMRRQPSSNAGVGTAVSSCLAPGTLHTPTCSIVPSRRR